MSRLILASASPARARLLANAGVAVEIRPTAIDEAKLREELASGHSTLAPARIAERLAAAKARAGSRAAPDALIIAADQVLDLDGEVLAKPAGLAQARAQLRALRGRSHRLETAVACAAGGDVVWSRLAGAELTMRNFSDTFLDAYLERAGDAVLGSVGAYQLEGLGAQLFERVAGDYFTILGLPLLDLLAFLRAQGRLAT